MSPSSACAAHVPPGGCHLPCAGLTLRYCGGLTDHTLQLARVQQRLWKLAETPDSRSAHGGSAVLAQPGTKHCRQAAQGQGGHLETALSRLEAAAAAKLP